MATVDSPRKRRWLQKHKWVCWSGPCEVINLGDGIQCTSPVCTWAMFAHWLPLSELVQLGDAMMRRDPQLRKVSLEDFERYLARWEYYVRSRRNLGERCRAFRGITKCRRALRLMQPNTDSMPETVMRLVLQQFGIHRAQVNWTVKDEKGYVVAVLDAAYVGAKTDLEYNGEYHKNQRLQDAARTQDLNARGWTVIEVTKEDLQSLKAQQRFVKRVATVLKRRDPSHEYSVRKNPMSLWEVSDGRRSEWRNTNKRYF
ncbi:DUF559 domain-containing protein [Bifidobacterium dolichotidis]|nr:DUF559 domain-containing protein [Bifidobacterium dolichotidis]